MSDALQAGADWLASVLKDAASIEINYHRAGTVYTLSASVGSTLFQVDQATGLQESFESRDYIFLAADLTFGLPQTGDRIYETIGGATKIYEVLRLPGQPPYRYSDRHRTMIRVHTKQVG